MTTSLEKQRVISFFESFINDTLKEDLKIVDAQLQRVNSEIAEFVQIKKTLEELHEKKDGFKTQVDIGCNFFLEAKVEDTSTFLFNLGLNIYLELTYGEAMKHIDVRVEALEKSAEFLRAKSAETKAHIKLMLFKIGELQNVNENASN